MDNPASYMSDPQRNHVVSFCEGIRVRRCEPVSRHNHLCKGTSNSKTSAQTLKWYSELSTIDRSKMNCQGFVINEKKGQSEEMGKSFILKVEKQKKECYKSMCPFSQGKLLHRHCTRSASILIFILVKLGRINSYYLFTTLQNLDIFDGGHYMRRMSMYIHRT